MTTTDFLATRRAEATIERTTCLSNGREVRLTLDLSLETPGEACVAVSSTVAFTYEPPLPDDIAVRLDDRLYDGLYDGLALIEGPMPPERLRLRINTLQSTPSLAVLLTQIDWSAVREIGDILAVMSAEGVVQAWPSLRLSDML